MVDSEVAGSAELSDEQDFAAVSSRETIESDKLRLEQLRQQYQQVTPTALPNAQKPMRPTSSHSLSAPATRSANRSTSGPASFHDGRGAGKRCARFGSPITRRKHS
ncbi:MAG: hypothetical protein R3D84_11720 [Paracoccaceae bacterium]